MQKILIRYKTIFVTGVAGFIESNLVMRLFKDVKGATIIGIDNINDYYDVTLKEYRLNELNTTVPEGITWKFVKGDIAAKQPIDGIFEEYKPQVVVNLAAQAAGRPDMTYFGFTNKLLKGETIQIFNYGNYCRDFTYVDDIVEGVVRVMQGALECKKGEGGICWG